MKKYVVIFSVVLFMAVILYAQPGPIQPFIIRFLDLIDVAETTFTGEANKYVRVNAGETALEFAAVAGGGDLLADGSVPMTANWDIGNFDITLKSLTGDGTIEGATITEGGVGVPNVNDNLSVFAATNSAQLYGVLSDETGSAAGALAVFSKSPSIDSPTFTTAITATDLIDSAHYNADSIDNEHINWANITNLDDNGVIIVADTADATSFVALWESATGSLAAKSDAALTYNATTGTLSATALTEGGTGVYNTTESDAAYQPLEATLTDIADGTINENLVNTANPWAVNEGGTGAASLNDLITLTTHTTGNYAAGDAEAGNALTGDAALNFFGAGVTAVTDATACTDVEGTGLSIAAGTLNWSAASTDLTDTADLLYELELDTFAKLDTQIADKALINLADGGTFTGNIIANANLSVGNAGTSAGVLTLLEDDDDGANFASFIVPALAANTVYILPPDDGDNTEVLQTNGTGTLTWVANAGGGATAWDDISDPDNNGATTITFDNNESTVFTGNNDAAVSFVTIQNSDADHTGGNMWLLDLDYSADDGDADADFIKCQDSGGTVFSVSQDGVIAGGNTTITGTFEATSITEGLIGVPNLNEIDWINADEMADADHGDVEWAAGIAYVQAATIADTAYASCYVGLFQGAAGNNEPFYTDAGLTYDATSGTLSSTILTEGGLAVYNSGETPGGSLGGTWADPTIDDLFLKLGGDVATAGNYDFGGADLEIPQASPAVPDADGEVEYDFTDGKLVIQHGSAHAELGGATDVAIAGLIESWGGTIWNPDTINDVITVKAINSIEFPHGVVITAVYLGISSDTGYVLTIQNFDDFDTINAGNPTIDTVTYPADTTGEIIDTTPTYATIAAGQIIMISIPATDVDWINFCIYYYEPAA